MPKSKLRKHSTKSKGPRHLDGRTKEGRAHARAKAQIDGVSFYPGKPPRQLRASGKPAHKAMVHLRAAIQAVSLGRTVKALARVTLAASLLVAELTDVEATDRETIKREILADALARVKYVGGRFENRKLPRTRGDA